MGAEKEDEEHEKIVTLCDFTHIVTTIDAVTRVAQFDTITALHIDD